MVITPKSSPAMDLIRPSLSQPHPCDARLTPSGLSPIILSQKSVSCRKTKEGAMIKRLLIMVLAALMTTSLAAAMEIGGVKLPDSMQVGEDKLLLNGAGLRKKFFVKVYAGGLYLKKKNQHPQKIIEADESMAVRMHFIYDGVSSKKLIDGWNEGFAKATGGNILPIKKEIDQFNSFFTEEVKKDDIYDIIYNPGQGVSVFFKGTLKGTIKGLDFKKALFAIWLGKKPVDSGLKEGMLDK
jgi:hypothetical protein